MKNGARSDGTRLARDYSTDDPGEWDMEAVRAIQKWAGRNLIMYKEAFGKNLTALMKERGWSKEQAATVFDVSPSMIYLYMSGTNLPEGVHLARIADILDVSIDWLLGRTDVRVVNRPRDPDDPRFNKPE